LVEGKIVAAVFLPHEVKYTSPFSFLKFNKAVSILPHEAKALLELFFHLENPILLIVQMTRMIQDTLGLAQSPCNMT